MCFIIERLECDFDRWVNGIEQQAENKDFLINMSSNITWWREKKKIKKKIKTNYHNKIWASVIKELQLIEGLRERPWVARIGEKEPPINRWPDNKQQRPCDVFLNPRDRQALPETLSSYRNNKTETAAIVKMVMLTGPGWCNAAGLWTAPWSLLGGSAEEAAGGLLYSSAPESFGPRRSEPSGESRALREAERTTTDLRETQMTLSFISSWCDHLHKVTEAQSAPDSLTGTCSRSFFTVLMTAQSGS